MSTENYNKTNKIIALLYSWLKKQTSAESLAILERKQTEIRQNLLERNLFIAFSSVSRYLSQQKLELSTEELQAANELIIGWNPIHWNV